MTEHLSPGDVDLMIIFALLMSIGYGFFFLSSSLIVGLIFIGIGVVGLDVYIALNVYVDWQLDKAILKIKERKNDFNK